MLESMVIAKLLRLSIDNWQYKLSDDDSSFNF